MKHRIRIPFPAAETLSPGQIVDTTSWINREMLEQQGYIEPVVEEVDGTSLSKEVTGDTGTDMDSPAKRSKKTSKE